MGLTEQQLAVRRTGIGASEVGALAGLSRYLSPIDIYESKVNGLRQEMGLSAKLGTLLEEPLAQLYSEERKCVLVPCDTLRHSVQTFALATPDRAVWPSSAPTPAMVQSLRQLEGVERLVQIKTTDWRSRHLWGAPGTDAVPEEYVAQVTWEMGVTGIRHCDVYVLFDRDETACYPVPFSEVLWEGLLEVAGRFWRDHVVARVPPPPDASDGYREFLERQFPAARLPDVVDVSGQEIEAVAVRYGQLKRLEKLLEAHLKRTSAELRAAIGDRTGISGVFGTLKWLRKPDSFKPDYEKMARELQTLLGVLLQAESGLNPDLREHYTRELRTIETLAVKPQRFSQLRGNWSEALPKAPIALEPINDDAESADVA